MSCNNSIYTISDFLKGVNPSLVDAAAVMWVCAKRGIEPSESFMALSERDRDLAEGTMYYWLSSLNVGGSTEKVADGGFSHSKGGWTVSKANIDEWKSRYRELFAKWNEPLIGNSKIRIINL